MKFESGKWSLRTDKGKANGITGGKRGSARAGYRKPADGACALKIARLEAAGLRTGKWQGWRPQGFALKVTFG